MKAELSDRELESKSLKLRNALKKSKNLLRRIKTQLEEMEKNNKTKDSSHKRPLNPLGKDLFLELKINPND